MTKQIKFTDKELGSLTTQKYPAATHFWQIYEGRTRTGWGQVSIIWEVVSYDGVYSCQQLSNNTVGQVNPDYRENFTEDEINKILIDTPIINSPLK